MKKLLVLILVLIPVLAFAGVDDTNFKCYTITPDKMLGVEANTNLEDTPYAQEMTNIYNNGDSIVSFSHGTAKYNGDTTSVNTCIRGIDTDYFYKHGSGGALSKPYYGHKPISWDKTSWHIDEITSFPFTGTMYDGYFFTNGLYGGVQKTFIMCDKGIAAFNYDTKIYETNLTPDWWIAAWPKSFTVWKKRLFASACNADNYYNYIFYSKAGDFSNFTATNYAGGVVTIQPYCQIYKLAAVADGLYIFTSDGIYYLSGGLPETWRLEKVSNLVLLYQNDFNAVCVSKNQILFMDTKFGLYTIGAGSQVNKITIFPFKINLFDMQTSVVNIGLLQDRYILIPFAYQTKCMVYDLKAKSWYVWDNIINVFENGYGVRSTSLPFICTFYEDDFNTWYKTEDLKYQNKVLTAIGEYPDIKYEMPWYSLDGSPANYKKLKRIEIDVKGYASSNSIKLKVKTNKNSSWQEISKSITDNLTDPNVYFDDTAPTYTFKFIGTNEFQKIKLRLETKYSVIISQIRIIYEPVGVK